MRYNEGAMKNTTRKSLIAAIAVYGLAVLTTPINAQPPTSALDTKYNNAYGKVTAAETRIRQMNDSRARYQSDAKKKEMFETVLARYVADLAKAKAELDAVTKEITARNWALAKQDADANAKAKAKAEADAKAKPTAMAKK